MWKCDSACRRSKKMIRTFLLCSVIYGLNLLGQTLIGEKRQHYALQFTRVSCNIHPVSVASAGKSSSSGFIDLQNDYFVRQAREDRVQSSVSRESCRRAGQGGLTRYCSVRNDPIESHRKKIQFRSTLDGTLQEAFVIEPDQPISDATCLVINLHSWSADMNQRSDLEELVYDKNWFYLFPNFRGANKHPAACGSQFAQQDIIDALEFVLEKYVLDRNRVFLSGTSGGGHMTMLMAGKYPERWRAACSWVGISDLRLWHKKHQGGKYGKMIEQCCGGLPGESATVDEEYRTRSPVNYLSDANRLPLALFAGIKDGHQGSVPISHSIEAFNVICNANNDPPISQEEMAQLSTPNGRLLQPQAGDEGFDHSIGRKFYLRRTSKMAQITIFEGGHEGIAAGTMSWFEKVLASQQ